MANLILNRAWHYRMGTMPPLVERIRELKPDHLLVTGDLTTTSLEEEFQKVRRALEPVMTNGNFMTVIPGNHDRYTKESDRAQLFEKYFGEFSPSRHYPWLREVGEETAILGLDPCRPNRISARGRMDPMQLRGAGHLLASARPRIRRLLIACHYPVALPRGINDGRGHGLIGRRELHDFLAQSSPAVFCHGHIHATWAFQPETLPGILCLDPGPALKHRRPSGIRASMLEICLTNSDVEVRRHALRNSEWQVETLTRNTNFFQNVGGGCG